VPVAPTIFQDGKSSEFLRKFVAFLFSGVGGGVRVGRVGDDFWRVWAFVWGFCLCAGRLPLARESVDFENGAVTVKTAKTGETVDLPLLAPLRTTFVTLALSAGVPMELVRKVAGHRTVVVVMANYFRPGREALRAELLALAGA